MLPIFRFSNSALRACWLSCKQERLVPRKSPYPKRTRVPFPQTSRITFRRGRNLDFGILNPRATPELTPGRGFGVVAATVCQRCPGSPGLGFDGGHRRSRRAAELHWTHSLFQKHRAHDSGPEQDLSTKKRRMCTCCTRSPARLFLELPATGPEPKASARERHPALSGQEARKL